MTDRPRILDILPNRNHLESIPMIPTCDREEEEMDDVRAYQHIPSNSRHIWGFYCYSFASEIFAIVAVTLFTPITLEQFARDNGSRYPYHDAPCYGNFKNGTAASSKITQALETDSICEVRLLGKWFDTASFPLYVFSISVAVQAVMVCSLGDAADNPTIRKLLLVTFAAIGSLSGLVMLILESSSRFWPLIACSAIISNVCLGGSLVCLNSFIPSLCKSYPDVLRAKQVLDMEDDSSEDQKVKYHVLLSNKIADLSAKGISFGYGAGILALFVSLIPVTLRNGDTTSLRWAIGASAIWWAVFTIPSAIWLPPSGWRSHTQFSETFNPRKSWTEFSKMLQARRRMRNTFYYLMAWFLLSDAFSTITSTAIIFGKTTLHMPSSHLILIGIITPATGILGALLAPSIQAKIPYCSGVEGGLKMFKLVIGASCLIPAYVCSGVLFNTSTLGTEWEMYVLASVFGILYGAFQSYARSLFAELIPPRQEAKWYALFSITDKSSSFFGPFIVGAIADYTHNIRFGFLFILVVLLASIPLLSLVEMTSGKEEAEQYSLESGQR